MAKFQVKSINHVCLVVRNRTAADAFYVDTLGFKPHHKIASWLVLNNTSTLHLVHIPEAKDAGDLYHEVQHFALEVDDLREILGILLDAGKEPFQMDFEGKEQKITDRSDSLSFGLGTLFVHDPDRNLVEFLQEGRGIFTRDMRPRGEG